MQAKKSQGKLTKWLGTAAFGTGIGVAAGAVVGFFIGGVAGGWFWYTIATDGTTALGNDFENLFAFLLMIALAVCGVLAGVVVGGVAGILVMSIVAAVSRQSRR